METESLRQSLKSYEEQLRQINNTLEMTSKEEAEYETLLSLQTDMKLLIDMTKENLEVIIGGNTTKNDKVVDDEYARFMAEMVETGAFHNDDSNSRNLNEGDSTNTSKHEEDDENIEKRKEDLSKELLNEDVNIEEELHSLQGMKCSVLYSHRWGGAATLHNAMVCSVMTEDEDQHTDYDSIKVKVLFTNPTHLEMVPCPYFLDGNCRFDAEQCRFSHGEVVLFSSLKEAIKPNFEILKSGGRVLAKIVQKEESSTSRAQDKYLIWHRAVVLEVDEETLHCTVKLEHDSKSSQDVHNVPFAQVFPLTDDTESDTDTESSCDNVDDLEQPSTSWRDRHTQERGVEVNLSQDHGAVKLGDWEKYTKGIGSKLMLNMGWISGSGLGVNAEGRLHPVKCQITPLGKSLDHVMEMKEGHDPSKIEKRLKQLHKRRELREKQAYEREKDRERHNVFNVLNEVLSLQTKIKKDTCNASGSIKNQNSTVKNMSCKGLNIEQFQLAENETRINREIEKIKISLARNSSGNSAVYKSLCIKLGEKQQELENIKKKQSSVTKEQDNRKHKSKLTIF